MNEAYLMELIAKLEAAPHGGRDAIVDAAAALVGKSKTTVYRALRKLGYNTQRKPRADKGTSVISDNELASIAAIQHAATRKTGKRLASAKTAVEIAAANGLAAREYSAATVNRQLRERGLSGAQMRRASPHVQLASRHPNHMWQIDPSYCVLYYLKTGKGLAVMDEATFYKNKPHNFGKIARDRVLRYVCVDHCTGAFYCRYYNVSGENAETMFDFLMRAMGSKDKQHNPFEGVPKILYWDKGSANQSSLILALLEGLGIEHHAHVKGNSRAKGSVEKHNDLIETNFESRLTFAHIESIEQLNAACERWQRHYQATHVHSRHGMTRFAAWRKITPEQLIARPPLEICRLLLTGKAGERTVGGNYHISYAIPGYGSRRYRVADVDNIRIGETVTFNRRRTTSSLPTARRWTNVPGGRATRRRWTSCATANPPRLSPARSTHFRASLRRARFSTSRVKAARAKSPPPHRSNCRSIRCLCQPRRHRARSASYR